MDKLIKTIKSQKNIKNYRIYKTKSKNIVLGVKGEIIGGPYNPIQTSFSINGELQIEWNDKKISLINLTSSSNGYFPQLNFSCKVFHKTSYPIIHISFQQYKILFYVLKILF